MERLVSIPSAEAGGVRLGRVAQEPLVELRALVSIPSAEAGGVRQDRGGLHPTPRLGARVSIPSAEAGGVRPLQYYPDAPRVTVDEA